jgi:hypothetical protein
LFGNDLNAKLDRERQVQGADFRDLEFGVCSKHCLRIQGFFQTLLLKHKLVMVILVMVF